MTKVGLAKDAEWISPFPCRFCVVLTLNGLPHVLNFENLASVQAQVENTLPGGLYSQTIVIEGAPVLLIWTEFKAPSQSVISLKIRAH